MATLPTPRTLLTDLLTALSALPTSAPNQEDNALKHLPAPQRALFAALHVLLPQPILLPALDLLDRGLVTRIVQLQARVQNAVEVVRSPLHLEDAEVDRDKKRNVIYQVRSSQAPKGRFRDALSSSTLMYTVRLQAWNCSCAAFVFSAFSSSHAVPDGEEWGFRHEKEEGEFGGLSFDGCQEGGVPVCKHLLACVLGERVGVLGRYVKERDVSKEEMVGIVADG